MQEHKRLQLTESFLDQYKNKTVPWGFGGLGEVVFLRTYSRVKPDGEMEQWWETVRRVVEGCYYAQIRHCDNNMLPFNYMKGQMSAQKMYDLIFNMKFLPPGRGLWTMGTKCVEDRGSATLVNCSFVSTMDIKRDFASPFCYLMDMSMLGVGVGGDTRGKGTVTLKKPTIDNEWSFVVQDSRQGWVESVRVLLNGYGHGTKIPHEFDYSSIRPFGEPLKTFGGVASGPQPLIDLHVSIRSMLDAAVGKDINSTIIVDLFNLIGKAVVSGGIRRCLPAGTIVLTDHGNVKIENIKVGMNVLTSGGYSIVTDWLNQGNQEVIKIVTDKGSFRCTSRHKIAVLEDNVGNTYKWVQAGLLYDGLDIVRVGSDLEISRGRIQSIHRGCVDVEATYDITVASGEFVIEGGFLVHNSAEIMLGDSDDQEFLSLKDPQTNAQELASHRWVSNNSIFAEAGTDYRKHVEQLAKNGEPGFNWLENARHYGRMKDGYGDHDLDVVGVNPCFAGDTEVLVAGGVGAVRIDELARTGRDVQVYCMDKDGEVLIRTARNPRQTGNGNTFRIVFEDDSYIDATFNHKWQLLNGIKKTTIELFSGDQIPCLMEQRNRGCITVKEVLFCDKNKPVYNLTVDEFHTYVVVPHGRGKDVSGVFTNNCGEVSLASGELCNLVDVFPANHDNERDFLMTLKYAYLYAKSVTLIPTHNLTTNAIVQRNRRIGTSVSGIVQSIEKFGYRKLMDMLDSGYTYLKAIDRVYSRWLCISESIKCTTVKPSGTVSLLAGATPGVHFPHSEYYIRNIRFDKTSKILPSIKRAGYTCEDAENEDGTVVVSFPVHETLFMRGKRDVSVWEQLELAAQLQYWWADNQVSVTVSFRENETSQIETALTMYETRLKSVSFLPIGCEGYAQAPYIEINQEQYEKSVQKIKHMKLKYTDTHEVDDKMCTTDVCEVKMG